MVKKIVWLVMSCLMVVSLIVASCSNNTQQPASTGNEGGNNQVVITEGEGGGTTSGGTETTPASSNEPQYGGTLSLVYGLDPMGFDDLTAPDYWDVVGHLTCDQLLEGDWAKGPEGTGEFSWNTNDVYRLDSKSGALAESFEIVSPGDIVLHIRHGVHYTLNSDSAASLLVNGREMTGQDVYWNINRWLTGEGSQVARSAPGLAQAAQVTLVDPWTIEMKLPADQSIYLASYLVDWCGIIPPEIVDTYGNMNDWHNNVGTGPYYLSDYVVSSVLTMQRNPSYWQTDPVGPGLGNQLPYVNTVKYLIISDASTALAAVRTGQVDVNFGTSLDDFQSLTKTAKDLDYIKVVPAASSSIAMRIDKPELPFSNKEVRQALMMAIDYNTIIEDLYQGQAQLPSFPIVPEPDLKDAYLTLDEAPQAVKDIFTYNVDEAKTMLANAGYPDGFKTNIVCTNLSVDYLSIIKDMWSKVSVELDIQTVDTGAYNSQWAARNYDELFQTLWPSSGTYVRMLALTGNGVGQNMSYVNDDQVNSTKTQMLAAFAAGDQAQVDSLFKNLMPYVLEQTWCIQAPVPYTYTVWWPWIKGYSGEYSPGVTNEFRWAKYVWINQALKTSMGY